MNITVTKGSLADFDCEVLLVGHFEDNKAPEGAARLLDEGCNGIIGELIDGGDFEGKLYTSSVVYTRGSIPGKRILVTGLGKKKEFDLEKLRGVFSKAAQKIRDLNITQMAASLDFGEAKCAIGDVARAAAEGALLGLYRFTPYKTLEEDKKGEITECIIVENRPTLLEEIKKGAQTAQIISRAVYCARDLVSTPPNDMTPSILADRANTIASEAHLTFEALDEAAMGKLGMNALLGVARGSAEEARLITLQYNGGEKDDPPVVLVGKGITFDSGGISIKPSEKMDEMKSDMAGGAAVIATIKAAADLKLPLNVVAIVPATENLPGGRAYKPGDILKTMSGLTVEIKNTDAEGRLILADALTFAGRYNPAAIIDMATLTGACVVALGDNLAGMMGTDEDLKKRLSAASDATGEMIWELPLWHEYNELIKSDVADIKNVGTRAGGTITAALFLKRFAGDYPWVHLDIAGPALLSTDRPYIPKGASGIGVRLLTQFLMDRSQTSHVSHP
ncbi:MAG: leucyl aminopeptidase [Deltaproteobacteria bacterium]|nr:leucyl aminopeptidase [Deltaproteobacteria bacterium]